MKKLINQIKLKLATLMIAIDPKSATGWKIKAENEQALFKYDEAIASYNKYLSLCSCDFNALTVVGALLNSLGRTEDAIVFFDRAIDVYPEYIPAILNKGYAYSRLAKYEEAIDCYNQVLLLNCRLVSCGEPPELDSHYRALLNKGHAFQFLGEQENAIECYDQAITTFPSDCEDAVNNRRNAIVLQSINSATN